MRAQGIPVERLSVEEGARLFPSFRGDDLEFLLHEPEAGVLRAQSAVQTLAVQAAGARRAAGPAAGPRPDGDRVVRRTASALEADAVVWSCGGWLPQLFPDLVSADDDAPGPVLPRRRRAVDARARAGSTTTARSTAPATSTGSASRARPTSRARRSRPTTTLPPSNPDNERWIRDYFARPLPGARRRAAEVLHHLPLRALARLALHRRPAPRARERVAARRRLRPRLQARPGDGRADGRRAARRASRCPSTSGSASAPRRTRCARRARIFRATNPGYDPSRCAPRLALALAITLLCAAPAAAQTNPIFQSPGIPPPGANNPACKPAAAHPYPVILVHGTFGDMTVSWNTIAPALEARGYCVWALDYGNRGTGDIDRSADQLVAFIAKVRSITGAAKVSMIGHSQGGMLARYVDRPARAARRRRRRRRPRPLEPRHDQPARRPGRRVRLHRLRAAEGRLGVHAQGQPAAARGARPRLVHDGHDHARRGRHALPLAGAGRRPRHQRDPAGPLPGRPVRARHDRRRPGRAAVGDQRARLALARRTRLPARLHRASRSSTSKRLKIALGKRTAARGSACAAPARRAPSASAASGQRAPQRRRSAIRAGTSKVAALQGRAASAPCSRCPAAARRSARGCASRQRASRGIACAEPSRTRGSAACTTT